MIACIITYNDIEVIKKSIESIYHKVNEIIVVDGKYSEFIDDTIEWYSTDGTLEYLESLEKVKLLFGAGLLEHEKRNMYIDLLHDGDMVLVLDSDEVVEGNIEDLPSEIDIGLVPFIDRKNIKYLATRLFRYRAGLRYMGVHYILQSEDGQPFNTHTRAEPPYKDIKVNSFKIKHLWHLRDDRRQLYKSRYYKTLNVRETAYKRDSKFHIK